MCSLSFAFVLMFCVHSVSGNNSRSLEKCVIHLWVHCKRYKWARCVSGEIQVHYDSLQACMYALIHKYWVNDSRLWGFNMTILRACHLTQLWPSSVQVPQPICTDSVLVVLVLPPLNSKVIFQDLCTQCCYHSALSAIYKSWSSFLYNFSFSSHLYGHDIF